jgi:hypothetical protein
MDARNGARPGAAGRGLARQVQGKDHGPAECTRGTGQGAARPGWARLEQGKDHGRT